MGERMVCVPLEQYEEGLRATAILGAVCDMIRSGSDYASDSIKAVLGIKKEDIKECTSELDLKKEEE